MDRDQAALLDIARAARLVLGFTASLDEPAFLGDIKTQSSVLHQTMIMGDATRRLSDDYRDRNPEIPWALIAGMRDRLIHGYDIVDLEEVWRTASRDVPDLVSWLEPRLPTAP